MQPTAHVKVPQVTRSEQGGLCWTWLAPGRGIAASCKILWDREVYIIESR